MFVFNDNLLIFCLYVSFFSVASWVVFFLHFFLTDFIFIFFSVTGFKFQLSVTLAWGRALRGKENAKI